MSWSLVSTPSPSLPSPRSQAPLSLASSRAAALALGALGRYLDNLQWQESLPELVSRLEELDHIFLLEALHHSVLRQLLQLVHLVLLPDLEEGDHLLLQETLLHLLQVHEPG